MASTEYWPCLGWLAQLRTGVDHESHMHRCRSALPTILTILVGIAVARSAWAHTIIVVRPYGSDPMLTESFSRLCGELQMYGLKVVLLDNKDGASLSSNQLAEVDGSADVVGGVALLRTPGQASAKIWIADAATGKESVRITVSIDDADAPSLLAIRAADLLRASLRDVDPLEHAQAPKPPGAAPEVSSSTQALPPATVQGFDRWDIRGGASTLWETGDLGVGFAANVGLARRISPRLALELSVVAPVIGQAYAGAAATARLREELGILSVAWRPVARPRLTLDIVQGFGAMYLSVRGEAQSPWLGQSSSAWAAASSTGGCIGLGLSQHVSLSITLAAVFVLPRPVLDVANVSYVTHEPLILATGGFRYGF